MVCSKLRQTTRAFSSSNKVTISPALDGHFVYAYRHVVVADYGLETVQEYMYHIRANAESSVRNILRDVAKRAGTNILEAVDYLDDGSPVSLRLSFLSLVVV